MNTQTEPALNSRFANATDEELLTELMARKHHHIARITTMLDMYSFRGAAAPTPSPKASAAPSAAPETVKVAKPKHARQKRSGSKARTATAAKVPAKKAHAKKKTPGAPAKKGSARAPGEKTSAAYALEALQQAGAKARPDGLAEAMRKAGWTTSSSNPADVVKSTLKTLVARGKVKFLGKNEFALA